MNLIKYNGIIQFEPEHITKKHETQGEWKRTAMIMFDGDITDYYAWFIKKRFQLDLNKPIRNGHVSFINDRFSDVTGETLPDKELLWHRVKDKWDNKEIEVILNTDVRTNSKHWWLNVDIDYREPIHKIRYELGLGKPEHGLHMTIGLVNHINMNLSKQIHEYIKNGLSW